jgi:hypothetical protein
MNTLNLIDGSIKKYYINDIDDLIDQLNKKYIYYSVFIDTTMIIKNNILIDINYIIDSSLTYTLLLHQNIDMVSYLKIIIKYELTDIMIDEIICNLVNYACPLIVIENISKYCITIEKCLLSPPFKKIIIDIDKIEFIKNNNDRILLNLNNSYDDDDFIDILSKYINEIRDSKKKY